MKTQMLTIQLDQASTFFLDCHSTRWQCSPEAVVEVAITQQIEQLSHQAIEAQSCVIRQLQQATESLKAIAPQQLCSIQIPLHTIQWYWLGQHAQQYGYSVDGFAQVALRQHWDSLNTPYPLPCNDPATRALYRQAEGSRSRSLNRLSA